MRRSIREHLVFGFILVCAALLLHLEARGSTAQDDPLWPDRQEIEHFLKKAKVTAHKKIGTGVTNPEKVTLELDGAVRHAVFKKIDEKFDNWRNEVAAYELDKLLGLGLVPPTVERTLENRRGSLQMWIENAMTEDDRKKRKREPPHVPRWNNQLHCVRLFHQLVYNTDFRNIRNVLADAQFRVFAVDNSRGFRVQTELLAPEDLQCFSRTALEKLKALDLPLLEEKLGAWVSKMQLEGLLARRDAILAIVEKRCKLKGEGAVLFY
jgi:hypothetical protein